jgi:tetratricopeptide (TPR) repeat protein
LDIELAPRHLVALTNLGTLLSDELNEYDKAIECFRKATDIDSKCVNNLVIVLVKKGWALVNSTDPNRRDSKCSIEVVEEAIKLVPQSAEAWQCFG